MALNGDSAPKSALVRPLAWAARLTMVLLVAAAALSSTASAASTPTPKLSATPGSTAPSPALSPTSTATPRPLPTQTPTATQTATPTLTPLPPTPTAPRLTPAPTGYFVPAYQGQILAPGLESGVLRGRVLDYRGFGIPNVPVSLAGNNLSVQTACGADGGFAFGGLKPAVYNLTLGGYPADPAQGLFVSQGQMVTVDFVEAERPGTRSPTASVVAQGSTPVAEATAKDASSVVIVVLTPEGGAGAVDRPTATPRPTQAATSLTVFPTSDNPLQAFGIGIVGSCCLVALAILAVGFRR